MAFAILNLSARQGGEPELLGLDRPKEELESIGQMTYYAVKLLTASKGVRSLGADGSAFPLKNLKLRATRGEGAEINIQVEEGDGMKVFLSVGIVANQDRSFSIRKVFKYDAGNGDWRRALHLWSMINPERFWVSVDPKSRIVTCRPDLERRP